MKKMGRKLILGTAFAVASIASAGCGNPPTGVYGPPPSAPTTPSEVGSEAETTFAPETNVPEDVYGPPPLEPEAEIPEAVYGPPEWFE